MFEQRQAHAEHETNHDPAARPRVEGIDAVGECLGYTSPHKAGRCRPVLTTQNRRIRDQQRERRHDDRRTDEHTNHLRPELHARIAAEQPTGLERGQEIGCVQTNATSHIGAHDVAAQVAGRDDAVEQLRDGPQSLRGCHIGFTGDARCDEAHDERERHSDDSGPPRNLEQPHHQQHHERRQDHEADGEPCCGAFDVVDGVTLSATATKEAPEAAEAAHDALPAQRKRGQAGRN